MQTDPFATQLATQSLNLAPTMLVPGNTQPLLATPLEQLSYQYGLLESAFFNQHPPALPAKGMAWKPVVLGVAGGAAVVGFFWLSSSEDEDAKKVAWLLLAVGMVCVVVACNI